MSVTAEQYQRPSDPQRILPVRLRTVHQDEVILGLIVRTGYRLGLSKLARSWHSSYTRINPWGKGGFVDRILERLAFFE